MTTDLTPLAKGLQRCASPFCQETFEPNPKKKYCSDRCRVNTNQLSREAPGLFKKVAEQQRRIEAMEREWLTRR